MRINLDITNENFEQIAKKSALLGNPRHLRILLILEQGSMTSDEVHLILEKENVYKHRENTYHALEKLFKLKIIKKEYSSERNRFLYFLK